MIDKPELGTQNKRINARASRDLYFANKPAGILHYLPLIFYISLHSRTSTIFLHPKNTRANRSISVDNPLIPQSSRPPEIPWKTASPSCKCQYPLLGKAKTICVR